MKLLPKLLLYGCMSLFAACGAHAEWKPEAADRRAGATTVHVLRRG
jgi:hypothetical protein